MTRTDVRRWRSGYWPAGRRTAGATGARGEHGLRTGRRPGRRGDRGEPGGLERSRRPIRGPRVVGLPAVPIVRGGHFGRGADRVAADRRTTLLPPRARGAARLVGHDDPPRVPQGARVAAVVAARRAGWHAPRRRGHDRAGRRAAGGRAPRVGARGVRPAAGALPAAAGPPGLRRPAVVRRDRGPAGYAGGKHRTDPVAVSGQAAGLPRGRALADLRARRAARRPPE